MSGFDAARVIRRAEIQAEGARVPIIALTAHVLGEAALAWQAAGMDGVLAKPFTLAQLHGTLAAFLPAAAIPTTSRDCQPASSTTRDADAPVGRLLNLQTLAGLAEMGDASFYLRVLQLFQCQAPSALGSLREATVEGDLKAVASSAHGLKSMSLNIGARELADRADAIEVGARQDEFPPDLFVIDSLEAMFVDTLRALKEYGDRLDKAA